MHLRASPTTTLRNPIELDSFFFIFSRVYYAVGVHTVDISQHRSVRKGRDLGYVRERERTKKNSGETRTKFFPRHRVPHDMATYDEMETDKKKNVFCIISKTTVDSGVTARGNMK